MDGKVIIGTDLDTKSFDAQIDYVKSQLDDIEDKLKQADMGFDVGDVQKLEAQYEKLTDKLRNLIKKKEEFNQKKLLDFTPIQDSIEGVGKSVKKVTKRIGKMALAVFGIRSAFMFVRNSINTIADGDKQLKDDIQYMKIALAYTLEPLVRGIVALAKELMFYVGYIAKAWFGVNIFANANKGLEQANKNAKNLNKELNKTTASFDEMNKLQDKSSSADSGVITPSFDFSDMENMPVPDWLQWIIDHKEEIISVLGGIAGGLTAIKLGFSGLQALGIGIAITGILYTIQKIMDFMKDPTFENFIGILEGIAITVAGVAIAFAAWPVVIGAAVALIVFEIVKHFDEIKQLINGFISWMDIEFLGGLRRLFGPLGDIIYLPIKFAIEMARGSFESFYGGIRQFINGVVKVFRGDFKGAIKDIFTGLGKIMLAPLNGFIEGVKGIWEMIKKPLDTLVKNINKTLDKINPINIGANIGKGIGSIGGKIASFFGFAKGGIVVPKLASGGIINQPGSGVPIASAVGGERGMEGVIPLTDSQQMALLGEMIGSYITVNLTNVTELDGRQIARKVTQINQNNNFVLNR